MLRSRLGLSLVILIAPFVVTLTGCNDNDAVDLAEASSPYAEEFRVVRVDPEASAPLKLAVQACAGLNNRKLGGSIYVQTEANDEQWLDELDLKPKNALNALDFLDECGAKFPACVRYSYANQQKLMPSILTVAAALGAVPLDVGLTVACNDVAFDATAEFAERDTPYLATKYVFENYINRTTGLAMLNPGYNQNDANLSNPQLTTDMTPALVDFVFSQKLFVTFLINGCGTSGPENKLLYDIVNSGTWPTPLGVYGYNNSWNIGGGYFYEAQTRCLKSRNMGAIPSETGNLSFFSTRRAPIVDANELERNELEEVTYDPLKTYVAFVIGDGDNIRFLMTARKEWLRQRLSDCGQTDNSCKPLTWSISPHIARLAPDVLKWYYKSSHRTGRDYFILPPSGHLYSYPTSMKNEDQDRFVAATEQDARVLGVNGTVHWDWFDSWQRAEDNFLPKYAKAGGIIRGVFPVNVPYSLPIFTWWPSDQFFKVLVGVDSGKAVVFRPREWRGVDDSDTVFFKSPQNMAAELDSYPPGTVTWVYMTSDGGLSLQNSFNELVKILPSHVQLVSTDTATRLALNGGSRASSAIPR